MDFVEVMHTYFRGEKYTGLLLVPVGLALLGFAVHLWRAHTGSFMWAMMVPLALAGAGLLAGGAFLAIKTDGQVAALDKQLAKSPAELAQAETERMAKVNANWPRLKTIWSILSVGSLVLLLVVRKDWATGLGLAFLLLSAAMMTLDVLAERRAVVYTDGLESLSVQVGDRPAPSPSP